LSVIGRLQHGRWGVRQFALELRFQTVLVRGHRQFVATLLEELP
jgi:hypothetical protein